MFGAQQRRPTKAGRRLRRTAPNAGSAKLPLLLVAVVVSVLLAGSIFFFSHPTRPAATSAPVEPPPLPPIASENASGNNRKTEQTSPKKSPQTSAGPANALNERDRARQLLDRIFNTSG